MKMKINRLLEITMILLNRGTVTAKELAQQFNVSTRTIYRDIDVLSTAGVPVYMNKGNGGGISLLEDYSLSKTFLSDEESESLLFALKAMQSTKYPETNIALEKIGAVFKNIQADDWIEIDFAGWSNSPNEKNRFADISNAILHQNIITFDYINANGEKSHRKIKPQKLYFNTYTWYLTGFCLNKNEERMFRLSRIKNVIVSDMKFKESIINKEAKKQKSWSNKSFAELKLRFSERALYRLYDEFEESYITKMNDGSYEVNITFPEDEWVYGFILSFGPYVEVIEPQHIRDIIAQKMREALKFYEK